MAQVIQPSIRTREQVERDLRRGVPMRKAPGENAPRPERRPDWLKVRVQTGENFTELRNIMRERGLHTVCEEAACPNIYECWESREATFLLAGDLCTRRCAFCDVMTAKPQPLEVEEPEKIAENALFDLDAPIVRIGGPHVPAMPYAPTLEHWFLPAADTLEQEMRKLAEF